MGRSAGFGPCELCERETERTFHHLIPRTVHRNTWFKKRFSREALQRGLDLCRDCHSAIHAFVPSEKELARRYRTRDALLAHPKLATFVAWAKGRPGRHRTRT